MNTIRRSILFPFLALLLRSVRTGHALLALAFSIGVALPLHAQIAGSLDAAFNPNVGVNEAYVFNVAVQPDGKMVIVGFFNYVNGEPRNNIARLNADGTVESTATFNPGTGPNQNVHSVAVQPDGKILLTGGFTSVDNQPRNYIARLNADGTLESTATFNPGTGPNGEVAGVAVQPDGKILLWGGFASVDGQPRNLIARLNADGSVESTTTFNPGTGVNNTLFSVAVQPDGKILLAGNFTNVNGQPRGGIARLNADGTLESTATFNPGTGVGGYVFSMTVQPDGRILLGGNFTSVDGQPRNYIARLNADGSVESTATFNPGTGVDGVGANNLVNSVAIQANGKILLGGKFTTVDGQPRYNIARLNPNGTVESTATFNPPPRPADDAGDYVRSATVQADGKIVIAGDIKFVDGQTRNDIARLTNDAATQTLTITGPSSDRVQWARGGASPEVGQVTFELSTDGGANWSTIGPGTRIAGGWERTGLSPLPSGLIRARGRTTAGFYNGSSGLVETVAQYDGDADGDGVIDRYETGTGIYVSPTDTGTSPTNPDTDGDGLNDGAEVNTYHSNPHIKDTDGDGFEDGFEVSTGFSPTSAASTPDVLSSIRTAAEYRFNAANGISYRIEASTDLANWATIETNIIGAGGVITRFYSIEGQPKRFFRSRRN